MIRFIFACLIVLVLVVLSIVLIPIGLFIGLFSKKARKTYAFYFDKIALILVGFAAGIKINCIGKENIVSGKPKLYVANHRSIVDIFATWSNNGDIVGYMAKDSLGKIPFVGWWIKAAGGIFIERENPRQAFACLKKAINDIKEGNSMFIFPEGTRNKNENPSELLEFKGGAKRIAQKTGCIVQPVAITHTDVFENHFPKFRKEVTTVEYLKPIKYEDLDGEKQKDFDNYCRILISEAVKKNMKTREMSYRQQDSYFSNEAMEVIKGE